MNLDGKIFQFSELLSHKDLGALQSFAQTLQFPENPSFVFHTTEKRLKLDEEVRKSHTVHIKDPQLLDFVKEKILNGIMKANPELLVSLSRDYVTFIRYDVGGFFDWHVDFEKVTINGGKNVKEMHLLYCVEGNRFKEGGELSIKTKGGCKTISEVKTTGGCVVFDKLLEHRAEEVKKGTKCIMTLDVNVSTIYSTLDKKDEMRFSKFVKGDTDHFTIGSYEQFKMLFDNISKIQPEKLSGWVPFLQLKIDVEDGMEVDFLPSGMCRIRIGYYYGNDLFARLELDEQGDQLMQFYFDNKENGLYKPERYDKKPPRWNATKEEREAFVWSAHKEWEKYSKFCEMEQYGASQILTPLLDRMAEKIDQFGLHGDIEKQVKLVDPSTFTTKDTPFAISLPTSVDWSNSPKNFESKSAGYSYYCNESNYSTFSVDYRYGWVKFEYSMIEPSHLTKYK